MKADAREVQAPESYATFWGPVLSSAPPAPLVMDPPADAKDAPREVTEGNPGAPRAERP
jgi:hypothetical protein